MHKISNQPTVSIVIPAYNEAEYLRDCLESIKTQVVPPDEVIVVDNNSTDQTAAIARSYPFVRLLQEPRQGTVYARNAGFNAANSEIIGRIDADTHLSPTWVLEVREAFSRCPQAAALTGRCYFYDVPYMMTALWFHEAVYYKLQAWIAGGEILWGSNMAIRREAWHEVHSGCSHRTDIPEDIDLSLVLEKSGLPVLREPCIESAVSLRRGNVSPASVESYLRWWPRVYYRHGRYAQAGLIWGLYAASCIGAAVAWPFLKLRDISRQVHSGAASDGVDAS